MRTLWSSLQAVPVDGMGRAPDLWLASGVAVLLGVLLVPMPAALLDGLLAINLSVAGVVLAAVLLAERPLALSTFPSLLLLTTLFRLALNVSTTRMILVRGEGGAVVEAFGRIVVGGDVVVGLAVFAVITLVQFLVIGKGAERVAEVGARFTLDAMPGKQMSIDAALRAGSIDDGEARQQREELSRESQFYGAMDGAMKFIRGDAIAGLAITGLNLVAGLAIGVGQHGLSISDAGRTYTLLTIGDGLVSQIPALMITLSAGMLTTRVAGRARTRNDLGARIQSELLGRPRALAIGAGFALATSALPGLPMLPFAAVAAVLACVAARGRFVRSPTSETRLDALKREIDKNVKQSKGQRSGADAMMNVVHPVGIDLDPALSRAAGFDAVEHDDETELIGELLPELRDTLFREVGVVFPSVRVRTHARVRSPHNFVIRLKDVPVIEDHVDPDGLMVVEDAETLRGLGVPAEATEHPWGPIAASSLPVGHRAIVEDLGYTTWSPAGWVALSLARVLRQNAASFVGLEETKAMLDKLECCYPTVVREAVPKVVTVPQLADILRRLVEERVSIRDLRAVLEALVDGGEPSSDPVTRTEHVRASLGAQIAYAHVGLGQQLAAVLLDPTLEASIEDAVVVTPGASYVAMDPTLSGVMAAEIARVVAPTMARGKQPVLLTRADIRRYVRKLIEVDLPDVSVLSYQELPPELSVLPLARVTLPDDALAMH